jgi:hypothetical protein
MATAQWVLLASFSMVFLAILLNLVAVQYAHGVIRSALDEGVRRATPAPAGVAECWDGIDEVLNELMAGPFGDDISTSCVVAAGQVIASANATFPSWVPGVPDISLDVEVRGVKESDV